MSNLFANGYLLAFILCTDIIQKENHIRLVILIKRNRDKQPHKSVLFIIKRKSDKAVCPYIEYISFRLSQAYIQINSTYNPKET